VFGGGGGGGAGGYAPRLKSDSQARAVAQAELATGWRCARCNALTCMAFLAVGARRS
jgi:hypothetical protein